VTCHRGEITFEYTGKSSEHREHSVADEHVCAVVTRLKLLTGHPGVTRSSSSRPGTRPAREARTIVRSA
jgi:hypothetical protein